MLGFQTVAIELASSQPRGLVVIDQREGADHLTGVVMERQPQAAYVADAVHTGQLDLHRLGGRGGNDGPKYAGPMVLRQALIRESDERSMMVIAFPGESPEYRVARDRLLQREIELRRATEAVAAARRELPPGGPVPSDYVFHGEGPSGVPVGVRLSELFAHGKDSLVIYSFMFPRDPSDDSPGPTSGQTALLPLAEGPCPSCVALLDQLDGAARHAVEHLNLAVVAKAPPQRVIAFGRERGWRWLRLLSSAGNMYNRDYLAETPDGVQKPMLTVFRRDHGVIRHFWSSELFYAPSDAGQDPRHASTLEPLWNLLDLTPDGRPSDWYEQLSYEHE